MNAHQRKRLLILGGGFGGLHAAIELERALAHQPNVEITLVNRENFFLFTPMLHEIAASDLVLGLNFSGFIAWFLWRTIYLSKLPRLEKKVRVALDWTLDLFFSKDLVHFMILRSPTVSHSEHAQTEEQATIAH